MKGKVHGYRWMRVVLAVLMATAISAMAEAGSMRELTFNPCGDYPKDPVLSTGMNAFCSPKIREAVNWLVDRDYIATNIMGGRGTAKYVPLVHGSRDYRRYQTTIQQIEAHYAYNPTQACTIIAMEMNLMGATMVGGVWHFAGTPVVIRLIVRSELYESLMIGEYLAAQLAGCGFTVDKLHRTHAEAMALWFSGDPCAGAWHIYTGSWSLPAIPTDEGDRFAYFYTDMGLPSPLWQAYNPSSDLYKVATLLSQSSLPPAERDYYFQEALWLCMEDSARVWLVDVLP